MDFYFYLLSCDSSRPLNGVCQKHDAKLRFYFEILFVFLVFFLAFLGVIVLIIIRL